MQAAIYFHANINNNNDWLTYNAIKTNFIKAKIDNAQQKIKFKLSGDKNETINHVINEGSKLAQKEYKTRHDGVRKVTHWELCKKLKFDHTTKWYLYELEFVQENETYRIMWFWYKKQIT